MDVYDGHDAGSVVAQLQWDFSTLQGGCLLLCTHLYTPIHLKALPAQEVSDERRFQPGEVRNWNEQLHDKLGNC